MGSLPSRRKTLPSPSSSPPIPGQGSVPMQAERSKATAVALGSFPAGGQTELSLRLGEPLTILSEDGDWWTVLSEVSGREYSVPSTHVAKVSHRWLYEGLSREKAEELLLLPGNPGGAFLIRESQSRRGCYSLSVRLSRPASWDRIRHYRIQRLDNGWLYISPRLTFPSLQALVDHYSADRSYRLIMVPRLKPPAASRALLKGSRLSCSCVQCNSDSQRFLVPVLQQALESEKPELAEDICCLLKEPCALQRPGPLPGKDIPLPVTVQRTSLNWKELDSSLLFSEAPATGEASLLSEGLRESLSSYISMTEDVSSHNSKTKSRGRKGNQVCGT